MMADDKKTVVNKEGDDKRSRVPRQVFLRTERTSLVCCRAELIAQRLFCLPLANLLPFINVGKHTNSVALSNNQRSRA